MCPEQAPARPVHRGARLLCLLVLFVAGLLPFSQSFFHWYTDERRYTNAAIIMVRSGDYATPRMFDGSPRLKKPVLPYWLVAASYRMFGIHLWAGRLPFILAGALVIALTYRIARALTGDPETAWLAAAIMFSHPQLILASIRSIPDVLLCLFMLLSACGILSLTALGQRTPVSCWAAYVGAGLAAASKGLLALVFLSFAWVFSRIDPPARGVGTRAPSIVHLPSMLVAVAVAGWWYAAMYHIHGTRLLQEFWGDQVAENMKHVMWQPFYRVPAYAALPLVSFLPWTLALAALVLRDRRALAAPDARGRWIQRFVLAWSLVIAVLFGLGEQVDPRYVLPAAPLLAILVADALQRAAPAIKARVLRYLLALVLTVLAALGFVLSWLASTASSGGRPLVVLASFLGVTAVLAITPRFHRLSPATAVALAVFLAFPMVELALRPIFEPDAGARVIAEELDGVGADASHPVLLAGSDALAGEIRILTQGRLVIIPWSRIEPAPESWPEAMILPAEQARRLDLAGYRTREVSTGVLSLPPGALLRALFEGRVPELLEDRSQRFVVAVRR
jgi:4-amino-4-deoxy-L-arabinose transferase-like glycosyltransferase